MFYPSLSIWMLAAALGGVGVGAITKGDWLTGILLLAVALVLVGMGVLVERSEKKKEDKNDFRNDTTRGSL